MVCSSAVRAVALGRALVVKAPRQDQRQRAGAGLAGGVRERRVVGGEHLVGEGRRTAAADELGDGEVLGARDEVAEPRPRLGHRLLAGEQAGVQEHEPRDVLGVLHRIAQADGAAPVVHDVGGLPQVQLGHERRGRHREHVVRVPVDVGRLVGAPEARQVGRDAAVAGRHEWRDDRAPQERPGRLAVPEPPDRPGPTSRVPGAGRPIRDTPAPREVGKVGEAFIGGAYGVTHVVLSCRKRNPHNSGAEIAPWRPQVSAGPLLGELRVGQDACACSRASLQTARVVRRSGGRRRAAGTASRSRARTCRPHRLGSPAGSLRCGRSSRQRRSAGRPPANTHSSDSGRSGPGGSGRSWAQVDVELLRTTAVKGSRSVARTCSVSRHV